MKISLKLRIYISLFKMMDGRKKYTLEDIIKLLNSKRFYLNKNCDYVIKALDALMISGLVKIVDHKYKITNLAILMRK